MTNEEFLEAFGHFAKAPNAIERLRRLILDLAVRGRLVPQDPDDEPASVLLRRIAEDRQRVTADKTRTGKPLPSVEDSETFSRLPAGWEFTRLGTLGEWRAGSTPSRGVSRYFGGGIPWAKSGELHEGLILSTEETVSEAALDETAISLRPPGDLLVALYGATLGKTAIAGVPLTTNQAICACTPWSGVSVAFLQLAVQAIKRELEDAATGGAQPNISRVKLVQRVIGLPPSDEQHRIVERVKELMDLCDELDKREAHAKELREATARSALSAIAALDGAATDRARTLITDHLNLCLAPGDGTAGVLTELRGTILDLAVRGRLVPQDPNEEPVSVLLERIQEEREQLIAEKVIKKGQSLPPVDGASRHGIPSGSEAVRLGQLCAIQPKVKAAADADAMFLPMERIPTVWSAVADPELRAWGAIAKGYTHFASGDVLVAKITPCFENRKSVVARDCGASFGAGTTELHVLRPLGSLEPEWLLIVVKSQAFISQGVSRMTGTAGHQRVPRSFVEEFEIALPPTSEQRRVVKRVNELMSLCDELEQRLLGERVLAVDVAESAVGSLVAQVD